MFNSVRVPGAETQHTGKGMEFVSDIFSWDIHIARIFVIRV